MRLSPCLPPSMLAAISFAHAEPAPIATAGAWTAVADTQSPAKLCAVQTWLSGGRLSLSAATDRGDVLRLSLYKPTWRIRNIDVPITLAFSGGETLNFVGVGTQSAIRADIPAADVKPLIHDFTADAGATLTLPEGHEAPWRLDLAGTTPTIGAMARCLEAAQIWLPPPFTQQPQPATAPKLSINRVSVGLPADTGRAERQRQQVAVLAQPPIMAIDSPTSGDDIAERTENTPAESAQRPSTASSTSEQDLLPPDAISAMDGPTDNACPEWINVTQAKWLLVHLTGTIDAYGDKEVTANLQSAVDDPTTNALEVNSINQMIRRNKTHVECVTACRDAIARELGRVDGIPAMRS